MLMRVRPYFALCTANRMVASILAATATPARLMAAATMRPGESWIVTAFAVRAILPKRHVPLMNLDVCHS